LSDVRARVLLRRETPRLCVSEGATGGWLSKEKLWKRLEVFQKKAVRKVKCCHLKPLQAAANID